MKNFKEYSLHFDFIVVGGGFTGLCAALAAARKGVRTALVQDRPVLGGNGSSEIRMHICGASDNGTKPELAEGGIIHELMLSNKRVNDSYNFSIWSAVLFDKAKREKNLTVFYNTTMHEVHRAGGKITEIDCYQMTTEKSLHLSALIFADCTGNGTLSAFAGAQVFTGSEGKDAYGEPDAPSEANSNRMGNTLLFKARDTGHPVKFIPPVQCMHFTEEQLRFRQHTAESPVPESSGEEDDREVGWMFGGICQDYGYWWVEIPGTSEDIVSEYEDIRDQLVAAIYGVWDHIKNGGDHGAENYELTWVGMLPGVRESRRIAGDYVLNEKDVLSNRRFPDAVAYGGWHIDNHVPLGLFDFDKLPATVIGYPGSYTIPYRSYIVRGIENLFVGGRCLSASKLGMASSRVMGTCAIGGQAIGTAAALAVKCGVPIREVDIRRLQQELLKDDCYIPGVANEDEKDLARTALITASSEAEGFAAANVVNGVSRTIGGKSNAWHSRPLRGQAAADDSCEWLRLSLKAPAIVSQVQITFDSNFAVEKKITLSSRRQNQQKIGVPAELVKDYDVELIHDGRVVAKSEQRENYQRLNRVNFQEGIFCDAMRIRILSTNGIPEARIFEVRIY